MSFTVACNIYAYAYYIRQKWQKAKNNGNIGVRLASASLSSSSLAPPPEKKKEEKNYKKVRLEVEQVEIDKTEFPPPSPIQKTLTRNLKTKKRMTTRKTTTKSKQKTAPPPTKQILDSPGCFFAPFSLFVLFCVLCWFKLRTGKLIAKFPLSALQGEDRAGDE